MRHGARFSLFATLLVAGCSGPDGSDKKSAPSATTTASAPLASTSASASPSASASASAPGTTANASVMSDRELGALITKGSENPGDFPSDNFVSNETSLLDVASSFSDPARKGRAYVGVGPDQNFSYMALMEPAMSYIVDIRRGNLLELMVYRACFEASPRRVEFLGCLLSRQVVEGIPFAPDTFAPLAKAYAEVKGDRELAKKTTEATVALMQRLGMTLEKKDREGISKVIDAFRDKGLSLAYTMEGSSRKYPTFGELMSMKGPEGGDTFLANETGYGKVRTMFVQNRVVPLVGDFSGTGALAAAAADMKKRGLTLGVFYTSNVEQYLFEGTKYATFTANVKAMPRDDKSLIVRVWFDQGKAHPKQRTGHRTTQLVAGASAFVERSEKTPYRSYWQVVTE